MYTYDQAMQVGNQIVKNFLFYKKNGVLYFYNKELVKQAKDFLKDAGQVLESADWPEIYKFRLRLLAKKVAETILGIPVQVDNYTFGKKLEMQLEYYSLRFNAKLEQFNKWFNGETL